MLFNSELREFAATARAADALSIARLVGRAVDRAEDELARTVEEFAGLPIHLGRHVQAPIQVAHHLAVKAQYEGACRLAKMQDVEYVGVAALDELRRAAQALRRDLGQVSHGAA